MPATSPRRSVDGQAAVPRAAGAEWPLTGRDRELRAIAEALDGRPPRSVLLVGAQGVGKTRLAREALRSLAPGRSTRWLTATRAATGTPFGALAPLLCGPRSTEVASTPDPFATALQRSIRALTVASQDALPVLVVDDAHLLDEPSAALMQQFAASAGIVVVATLRAGEAAPSSITALWKDDLAVRLSLDDLPEADVGALLTAALGAQVDRAAVAELAAESRGNVLFLRELVRGALVDGTLVDDAGVWRTVGHPVPSDRIVELVDERLAGLGPDARELLELAAYGEPLGGAELFALTDERLVEQLQRDGLLKSERHGSRVEVRIAHPLYGDVLRGQTSAVRVAAMARALAATLEATGTRRRDDLLRIGVWRLDGGGGRPEILLAAARAARWRHHPGLAERLARAAADAGGGFEASLVAAKATALQGRPQDAERELAALAATAADDDHRTRVAIARIAGHVQAAGDPGPALRDARAAEASVTHPALRRELAAHRAGLLLDTAGPTAAMAVLEPLLEGLEGRALAHAGATAGAALARLGRLREALDAADRGYTASLAALEEPIDRHPWASLQARCEILQLSGRFAEAARLAADEHRRGLDEGSPEARAAFLGMGARMVRDRGNVVSAARDAREAATVLGRLGRLGDQHDALSVLAQAQSLAGDAAGAREALAAADALGIAPPGGMRSAHLVARAWATAAEGMISHARGIIERAVVASTACGDLGAAAAALHDLARLGAPSRARDRLVRLAADAEGPLVAARAAHVVALADRDAMALDAVVEIFERLGADLLAAEAASDAAVAWREAGDVRRADAGSHRAAALAARCEGPVTPALAPLETRVRLTDAERETALLAAAGRSNPDIAAALQLSVRTVGNRLQRVYHKLGISRRSDLARLLR